MSPAEFQAALAAAGLPGARVAAEIVPGLFRITTAGADAPEPVVASSTARVALTGDLIWIVSVEEDVGRIVEHAHATHDRVVAALGLPAATFRGGEGRADVTDPVEEARALLADATPGPWCNGDHVGEPRAICPMVSRMDSLLGLDRDGMAIVVRAADAALIAAAPRLLAALADEVERLRARPATHPADGEAG